MLHLLVSRRSSHRYDVFEHDNAVGRGCVAFGSPVLPEDEGTAAQGGAAVMLLVGVRAVVELEGGLVERPFPVEESSAFFLHLLPLLVHVDPPKRHAPNNNTR